MYGVIEKIHSSISVEVRLDQRSKPDAKERTIRTYITRFMRLDFELLDHVFVWGYTGELEKLHERGLLYD